MYELIFYETARGDAPALEFLLSLEARAQAKADRYFSYLRTQGPDLPRPYADVVQGKIRELRVRFGTQQIRFLYFFEDRSVILVSGFVKKASAVPVEELERAERRMKDWLNR